MRRALAWKSYMVAVYCCPSLYVGESGREAAGRKRRRRPRVVEMSESAFRKVSYRDRPEGLLAVLRQPPLALTALRMGADPLVLVVESVEKPGNLGAMLRTAEAAGGGCGGGGRSDHRCLQPQRGARLPGIALHHPLWPWRTATRHWGGSARWACG